MMGTTDAEGDHIMEEDSSNRTRSNSISNSTSNGSSNNHNLPAAATASTDQRSSIPEDRIVESIYHLLMDSMCRDVAVNMHQLIKTGADDVIPSSWKLFSGTAAPTRRDLYPELYNGSTDESTSKEGMTDSEIRALLDKYAVDLPSVSSSSSVSTSPASKRRKRDVAEEEEKRRLLSKIQKEKESNYKDSEDDEEEDENTNDDEDEDDEDFKMEEDDEEDADGNKPTKKGRSLSSTSSVPDDPASSSAASGAPAGDATSTTTTTKQSVTKLDIWGKNPAKEPKNRLCRCQLCGRLISTSRFASHLDKCMGLSTSRTGSQASSTSMMMMKPGAGGTKKRSVSRG